MRRLTTLGIAAALALSIGSAALAQAGGSGDRSGERMAPPSSGPGGGADPLGMAAQTDRNTHWRRVYEDQQLRAAIAAALAIMFANSERRGAPTVARAD